MSEADTDASSALGQHTRQFLGELGCGPGEIEALAAKDELYARHA